MQAAVDSDAVLGRLTLIDPGEERRMAVLVARRDRAEANERLGHRLLAATAAAVERM